MKLSKRIGAGLLMCAGICSLTGCNANLSDEQIDKLMYVADNADKFMDNSLSLLEEKNKDISYEEASKLLKLTSKKLLVNDGGIRDNLVLKMYDGNNEIKALIYYYKNDGKDYFVLKDYEADLIEVVYENNDNLYVYEEKEGVSYKRKIDVYDSVEAYAYGKSSFGDFALSEGSATLEIEILNVDLLDNGNYLIECSVEGAIDILKYEISEDAKYVSYNMLMSNARVDEGVSYFRTSGSKFIYEYGKVDSQEVMSLVNKAKQQSLSN